MSQIDLQLWKIWTLTWKLKALGNYQREYKISAKESQGYFDLKKHNLWFDKVQWLQNPNGINGDNLNNVRREASRYFGNKKREYLKDNINELATVRTRTSATYIEE
jgi:hypothetical protein